MSTLILPCAGRSTRFQGVRPKWMLTYPDGKLMIQKAIEGLESSSLDRIIITIVKEHSEKYDAGTIIKQAFGNKVEICVLDDYTSSQSETVALTIKKMAVNGKFISKDCDSYAKVSVDQIDNLLVGVNLRKYLEITNVAGKSFIVLNEQNMVVDIIEKSVCSNIISIGIYGFKSADEFLEAQKAIKDTWDSERGEIYMSHVVSYMIGQKNYFSYFEAAEYEDWGLITDWRRVQRRMQTYIIDVDGIIVMNKGKYGRVNWDNEDIPLENNLKVIKKLADKGAQIIFCTARPESQRSKLECLLMAAGISWHCIVMGCNHSKRVIINDFANTNSYPSCEAINVHRDGDNLKEYIVDNG
ncbi:MAG TPA: hypothetical protein ACFYEH_00800 [Candidatus Brocadiaceae bacterium]